MEKIQDRETQGITQMILGKWSSYFAATYGAKLPEDYLIFDCETTGWKPDWDLPVEIGHVIVRGRQVVNRQSHILDWTEGAPRIDARWLQSRMAGCCESMAKNGNHYPFTMEMLHREGLHPLKVLEFYRGLFEKNREAGAFFVTQNGWHFDIPLLTIAFREFLDKEFEFGPMEVFDTGAMEKAILLEEYPREGETLRDYFVRICGIRAKGVYWNIKDTLIRRKLDEKHGLDMTQCHRAGWDAYACHLLFEEHRQ